MVQTHRCPATVSGSKSAETTEVLCLGKVQRVGTCREPGDLPYIALRRPFEGKGRQRVCRPRPFQVGVFLCVLLPVPCGTALLPLMWGKRRRGGSKSWFLPQRCFPLSSISSHERRESRVLGFLDSVQAHQYTREQSHGSPPVLGVWSKRPEWRRARAALWGPHGSVGWRLSLALLVRAAA